MPNNLPTYNLTKEQLKAKFVPSQAMNVYGYDFFGFVSSWLIQDKKTLEKLPDYLKYEVVVL